jgi:predicted nucleic acid-binding protein
MQQKSTPLHKQAKSFLEQLWLKEDTIYITEYNYAELIRGAYISSKVMLNLTKVQDLCKKFEIIYSDDESIHEYAKISAYLRLKGEVIGDFDELIASIVIRKKDLLYSHNTNHYNRIQSLQLQDWALMDKI